MNSKKDKKNKNESIINNKDENSTNQNINNNDKNSTNQNINKITNFDFSSIDFSNENPLSKITLIVEDDFRTNSSSDPKIYTTPWSYNFDHKDENKNIFGNNSINETDTNKAMNKIFTSLFKEIINETIKPESVDKKNTINKSDFSLDETDLINKEINKEINKSLKVDFSSTIGDISYLEEWFNKNLLNNKFIGDYNDFSEASIDNATINCKIDVLNWWLFVHQKYGIELKYSSRGINEASKNNKISSLDWWLNSKLELKYDFNAIDFSCNNSNISILNWWYDNSKNNKVRFDYTNNSLDNFRLEEQKLLELLKWFDNLKLELKYSTKFLSFIETWNYIKCYNYLLEKNLLKNNDIKNIDIDKFSESQNPNQSKPNFVNLFEMFSNPYNSPKQKVKTCKTDISSFPEDIQNHIKEKEEELNNNILINGKAKEYIDNLIKIPFGKYKEENIFKFLGDFIKKINEINIKHDSKSISKIIINNESDLINFFDKETIVSSQKYKKYFLVYKEFMDIRIKYINYIDGILNSIIYGHNSTKKQIKCIICQWLSGDKNKGIVLGVQGPPGVGKTTFIKGALSKCLVDFITYDLETTPYIKMNDDNNDNRPFSFISLGGTTNGSTLSGHNITYHGATSGDIVKCLKEAKIMNPILFFDELDKISNTEHGHEISSVLTHITDPVQNEHFTDRYFSEVKIDLSRCIIIFSYNNSSKIDKILLDRIQEIRLDSIKHKEKLEISKKFLIPEICKTMGYNTSDINITNTQLNQIILEYTFEPGVRKLKEKLQELIRVSHFERIISNSNSLKRNIKSIFIEETFADYPKINFKKINKNDRIGYINGMYATEADIGGITIIQVKPIYNKDFLSIQTTGSLEKVMNESIQVAKTVAWNLLNKEEQSEVLIEFSERGLHVHCPDGATPKDGPSAGTAITCAIYSALLKKPIKNYVAITGEIDLDGNVTMIGGLESKLTGAKRAGIKLALVPKENFRELSIIKKKNSDLIDSNFRVVMISSIDDVIKYIF